MMKTHSLVIAYSFYKSHGFSSENPIEFKIINKLSTWSKKGL